MAEEPPQLALSSSASLTVNSVEGLQLVTDHPRPPVETGQGGSARYQFSPDLTQKLRTLSQQSDATLFMTLLASFATLLYRYACGEPFMLQGKLRESSGGAEIVVGVPLAGRNHHLLESSIGQFTTGTFPLRIDLGGNPGFLELLQRVRRAHLSVLANGDVPLEPLVKTLQPERNLRHHPLCRVMLNLLPDLPTQALRLSGVTTTRSQTEGMIRRDLILNVWEENPLSGPSLHGLWRYKRDLFEPDTIARMADNFRTVLEQIVANPAQSVDEFPLFTN